jgi:hypothetical protein
VWWVLARSLVVCLTSAAIGLALATVLPGISLVLLPGVSYTPGLGLSATQVVEIAAAF